MSLRKYIGWSNKRKLFWKCRVMEEKIDPLDQLDDIENVKKYKMAGLIATKTVNEILKHVVVGQELEGLFIIGNNFVLN